MTATWTVGGVAVNATLISTGSTAKLLTPLLHNIIVFSVSAVNLQY